MTVEELKAKLEASEAKNATLEQTISQQADTIKGQGESIDNLDASIKSQADTIAEMQKKLNASAERMTLAARFRNAIEEKKDAILAMVAKKEANASIKLEIKLGEGMVSAISDRAVFGTFAERGVSSAPVLPFAFLANLPTDMVSAASIAWLEGAYTSGADYVSELGNAPDGSVAVAEKARKFGKIADHILLSSELQNFVEEVYNWAVGEAVKKIDAKSDYELFNGAGDDSTYPYKVYGMKTYNTAFSALAAGAYGSAPTVVDVILDAIAQIQKEGYTADTAIVNYSTLAAIKAVKDANGNYIYDQVNNRIGQVRVLPSANVGASEMVVLDSNCAHVKRQPVYELEIVRNAKQDGWDVYVRRGVQLLSKSAEKKGIIYVSSIAAAITAITSASSSGV